MSPTDAEFGDAEDLGVRIAVHRDDMLAGLHACQVLDRARDAHCEVEAGRDGLAGKAHLVGIGEPAPVHHVARAADGRAHGIGQFGHRRQVLRLAQAAADGDHPLRVLQRQLVPGRGEAGAADAAGEVARGRPPALDPAGTSRHFGRTRGGMGTHGRHLGAMGGRLDRGQDVAADRRAGLEQVAARGVDRQFGAVGRQSGADLRRQIRHERPASRRGGRQQHAGPALADQFGKAGAVWLDQEVGKLRRLDCDHLVGAGQNQALQLGVGKAVAEKNGHKLGMGGVGQRPPASQQLERDRQEHAAVLFGQYPDVASACVHGSSQYEIRPDAAGAAVGNLRGATRGSPSSAYSAAPS